MNIKIYLNEKKGGNYPLVKEFSLKFSHIKKLFHLSKDQVLKAVLGAMWIEPSEYDASKRGAITLDILKLNQIVEDQEAPPYRDIYTSMVGTLNQFCGTDKKKSDFLKVLVIMPYFKLTLDEHKGKCFKKYISPDDFNCMVLDKLASWEEHAEKEMKKQLGDKYQKAGEWKVHEINSRGPNF
jgi:hypothetical protein